MCLSDTDESRRKELLLLASDKAPHVVFPEVARNICEPRCPSCRGTQAVFAAGASPSSVDAAGGSSSPKAHMTGRG
jgi:hypothetical protein